MKILSTVEIFDYTIRTIDDSNMYLFLIAPYLKINDVCLARIKERSMNNTNIILISKKISFKESELQQIKQLPCVELRFSTYLYNRCILNEKFAITSSRNMYATPEKKESDCFFSKTHDVIEFKKLETYCHDMRILSERIN